MALKAYQEFVGGINELPDFQIIEHRAGFYRVGQHFAGIRPGFSSGWLGSAEFDPRAASRA
jgi:hypothetical protein